MFYFNILKMTQLNPKRPEEFLISVIIGRAGASPTLVVKWKIVCIIYVWMVHAYSVNTFLSYLCTIEYFHMYTIQVNHS